MSAAGAALAVLRWALVPAGPPPRGDLGSPKELSSPPPEARSALSELAAVSAARLRLGNPPLGERTPPGLDGLVVALAVALFDAPPLAAALAGEAPRTGNGWEWVIRHALVSPALPHVAPEVADGLRACSPLTMVLDHPPGDQEGGAVAAVQRLLGDRAARRALALALAQPAADPVTRRWRTRLLDRLRLDERGRELALDVYEAAMIHHESEHLARVRGALAAFGSSEALRDSVRLEDALATADWWGPLWAIERTAVADLQARLHLGYAYREGLRAYAVRRRMGVT